MKNKTLKIFNSVIIICFIFILFSCLNYKQKDELKEWELVGNVKCCLVSRGVLEKCKSRESLNPRTLITFNRNGQYKKVVFYDYKEYQIPFRKDGRIIKVVHYEEDGKIDHCVELMYPSDSIVEYKIFNGEGTLMSNSIFIKKEMQEEYIQTFTNASPGGAYMLRGLVQYDKNGNIISVQERGDQDEQDIWIWHEQYVYLEYDEKNNWTRRLLYLDAGNNKYQYIETRDIQYY